MVGDVPAKQSKRKGEKEKKKIPVTVWDSLKKSLPCAPEQGQVHVPGSSGRHISSILSRRPSRSGCSRSIANLRDVIHGSKRHMERPPICSPRSIGSSEFTNPVTHEVILSNSKSDLKITGIDGGHFRGAGSLTPPRISQTGSFAGQLRGNNGAVDGIRCDSALKVTLFSGSAGITCHKCGEEVMKGEDLEAHHLSKHAVTELLQGDSSRKIIEMICRTNPIKTGEGNYWRIERILKVQNMQKTLGRFEEHREMVKIKAGKLAKKHPRCLADGNELLRFHGTTVTCNLGTNGSSALCVSEKCSVCRILRHGFTAEELQRGVGVFTASTSARALESIDDDGDDDDDSSVKKKALLVCRVIAGRVHRPLEKLEEIVSQSGFDSVAGKVGLHSNIEELYLLNPRALLPCFVVICKS